MSAVDRRSITNSQYIRKETIELHGFDPDLSIDQVEENVLDMINKIKDEDEPAFISLDIEASHKLENKRQVMGEFISRKRTRHLITNRNQFKDKDLRHNGKLFISESMCPEFKSIDWKCRQLKKAGKILQCWFFNGKYSIKKMIFKSIFHVEMVNINNLCEDWGDK